MRADHQINWRSALKAQERIFRCNRQLPCRRTSAVFRQCRIPTELKQSISYRTVDGSIEQLVMPFLHPNSGRPTCGPRMWQDHTIGPFVIVQNRPAPSPPTHPRQSRQLLQATGSNDSRIARQILDGLEMPQRQRRFAPPIQPNLDMRTLRGPLEQLFVDRHVLRSRQRSVESQLNIHDGGRSSVVDGSSRVIRVAK